ncbi:WG repeat-containing protein [Chryseobacterium sp. CFBP8996]|uniref:WG repeat-containing protein n=1 Tax=Chryseobacterium sp. CFBP8996 TaxID=3096529 RepID=UPI002A6AA89E|nr:WG repeat-containing protein [Chryseobacterium sp. CFBP8996]MDY0929826.1 WG repeat-containing protein [Chryseobacterium sp. CFBP8996]
MKKIVFILFSSIFSAQSNQYKEILLSKQIGKEVRFYTNGYGIITDPFTGSISIIDSLGTISFSYPFKSEILRLSKERFILKVKEGEASGKTALIDGKGNQVIPLDQFKYRTWENKDRLIISKDGKDGVYDYNGKQIIQDQDKIEFANDSRFFVKKDKLWFIYNFDGQQVSDREFKENLKFYKGKVYLQTGTKTGDVIDIDGKTVSQFSNHYIEDINGYPFLITKNIAKNKYGIVDENEKVLAENIYEQAFVGRNYIYLIKDNKVSVFSKAERTVFPTEYHYVNHLFNGIFKTLKDSKNPKIAVVKISGEIILPKEYDVVEGFKIKNEDYVFVSTDGEERLLDKNFESVLDEGFQIEKIFFNNVIVKKDDVYYKFSPQDKSYTPIKDIVSIKPFQFYPAIICKNKENLYGMLDEEGKEIVPFIYDDIISFVSGNEVVVQKGDKFGVTNLKNEPLKEVIYDKYSADNKKLTLTKDKESEVLNFSSSEDKLMF